MQQEQEQARAAIRAAIAGLEAQRAALGEAIAAPALQSLREKLAGLEAPPAPAQDHPAQPRPLEAPPVEERSIEERSFEERRIVTILFSDIVGSTSVAEALDPEDWRDILAQVHAMSGRVVQELGGQVLAYLGDGLLALFGAQDSHEGDPENAIRAGLAIQAGLAALPLRQPLHMRVGIHSGWVVMGEIGSQARREFTATGDAVNLAARLQSAAPPGEVLISHDTYRLVRGLFDLAAQPLLAVKGKSEPVQTYLVQRAKPRPFRAVNRGVSGLETRTVGREAELQALQEAYRRAVEGHSLVWAQLVGEPGIGKSRLLNDMLDYIALRPEEIGLLKARAQPGDENHTFALIRHMWFDRFQISEDLPLAEAEDRWQSNFLWLRREGAVRGSPEAVSSGPGPAEPRSAERLSLEEAGHALGMMLGLPFAASPYAGALRHDPAQLKQRAFTVSRELLAVVRSMAHVVVLLEDLHWADPVSWEYLVQVGLEEAPARRGVFVLATARPEWNPPAALLGLPGYVQVNLASLPEAESQELARELLRTVEDTPPHVIQQVVERSEGVPYYAEELVNWFLDQGVIDRSRTPWRFDASRLGETPPPATLQHLLLTRLSALQDTERAALQRGSVFGRHFWEGGLGALGFPAAGRVLASLQPRNFVDLESQSSLHGEAEWSFHHNILHQVIYESVLKRRRRAWHRQAAAWLEAQARQAGRLDEFVEVLGEHAERAGEPSAAADWFARAGERARDLGASVVARRFFDRALQLAPRDDLERRWRILLGRDEVLSLLGETQARLADDAALLHIAQALGEDARLAEAHYRHGGSLQNQGDDLAANRVFDAGLEYARRAGSRMLEAQLLGVKVVGLTRVGSLESVAETAQAALAALEPLEDDSLRAGVLINVAHSYLAAGDYSHAAQTFEQQVAIHLRLGVLRDQLVGLSNLGYVSILLGRYAEGLRYIEQAQALAEKIGARRNAAYNQLNAGLAYTRQGDSRSACLVLEGAMADLAEIGDQFGQAAGRYYLGLALEQAGDFQAAAASYAQAVDAFRSLNAHAYATEAQAGLAHCALVRSDLAEAGRVGSQAWADLQKNGAQGMEFPIRAYLVCAQVFAALGNPADARQALELGCAELFQRADKISDPAWRASFIENIAEHRAILALQAALSS